MSFKKQLPTYDFDKFIGLDVPDIFMFLERPSLMEKIQKDIKDALLAGLERRGLSSVPTQEQVELAWKDIYIEHAKSFDLGILQGFGFTVEEFIECVMNRRRRRLGGKTLHKETPMQKVIATYAFYEAYKSKQTHGQALELAANWIDAHGFEKPATKITISKWLDELSYFRPSVLHKSNRGRKKNIK